MKLVRVEIHHFRGISHMAWNTGDVSFACFVGACDAGKSTILEAVDIALSSRWNVAFDDTDFHDCDLDSPIVIDVTLGALPPALRRQDQFGRHLRSWHPSLPDPFDEGDDGGENVITVRVKVEADLEPKWFAYSGEATEPKRLSARDRASFAAVRMTTGAERHLTWSRESALSRLNDAGDDTDGILATARREARHSFRAENAPQLAKAAASAMDAAKKLGFSNGPLQAHIDPRSLGVGTTSLTLHRDLVPARLFGLGSRRLLGFAMQLALAKRGSIALIDEIEHGLEPFRVRGLLQALRDSARTETTEGAAAILMTSHSPVAIAALRPDEIHVVRRSDAGAVTVRRLSAPLAKTIQRHPEALLAPRVLVCEGKTEVQVCVGLDQHWATHGESFGSAGIALTDGGGIDGGGLPGYWRAAIALNDVGYAVAVLADADQESKSHAGIPCVRWGPSSNFETRLSEDVPIALLADLYSELPAQDRRNLRARVFGHESSGDELLRGGLDTWPAQLGDGAVERVRAMFAEAALDRDWYKRGGDLASSVGRHLAKRLPEFSETPLGMAVKSLRDWAHG